MRDVRQAVIAGHQGIDQDARRDRDQHPDGINRAFRRHRQKRPLRQLANDRSENRIDRETEGKQNRERADVFHIVLA